MSKFRRTEPTPARVAKRVAVHQTASPTGHRPKIYWMVVTQENPLKAFGI